MAPISEADRDRIAAAVAAAEAQSDGEIVTIIAARSDAYNDVPLHYAVLLMLLVPAFWAVAPESLVDWTLSLLLGWNAEPSRPLVMLYLFVKLAGAFLVGRYLFGWTPIRMALTPGRTKSRRVHRRALELFQASCAQKTRGRTGILLYLSLAERRAEIVADEAIASQVSGDVWGDAMHGLVSEVRAGRAGEGMVQAVEQIGAILARLLPPKADNPDELPNRLILL